MGSVGRNAGSGFVSSTQLMNIAQNYVSLTSGEQFAKATSAKIIGDVDEDGMANVEVQYETTVRVAVGYDPELQRMEYEDDTEYRKVIFRMKVR